MLVKIENWLRIKLMPRREETLRIGRTLEGTVFEIVFLLLSIAALVLLIWGYLHSGERVASFDHVLLVDEGNTVPRWSLFVSAIVVWVPSGFYLLGAYFPKSGDMGRLASKASGDTTLMVSRWRRLDALLGVLLVMALVAAQGHEALGLTFHPMWLLVPVFVLMVAVWLFFFLKILRRRKKTAINKN